MSKGIINALNIFIEIRERDDTHSSMNEST